MTETRYEHDVLVVGGGGAGLRAAIAAHEAGADVAMVTKLHPVRSHTGAAEGGINTSLGDTDTWEEHAYDTMKGADYLGDAPAIEYLCRTSPEEVVQLEHWGMPLARDDDGTLARRYLAGHTNPRTAYAGAETGHHLLHTLYEQLVKRGIRVYDEWYATRLAVTGEPNPDDRTCHGVVAYDIKTGELGAFRADETLLATGGLGQVFDHTTNAIANTGDGQAMAYRAGVPLQDMEFVQFHPTTLPSTGVLISEGVRGEGGILYNADGERFMFEHGYATNDGELASRDVVSRAELLEVAAGRGIEDDYVHLDMRHLGEALIKEKLENILHLARDFEGANPLAEPIPVKPGQHFQMGGIETDEYGRTVVDGLYAVGECACVSVHGSNRLGGNALPELFVFGARAGQTAASDDRPDAKIQTGDSAQSETGSVDVPLGETDGDRLAPDIGETGSPDAVIERALEAERSRIDRLMGRDGRNHAPIRASVQETMMENVSVFRAEDGLLEALETIREARTAYQEVSVSDPSRTFNTDLIHTIETRNLLDVAEAIAASALVRTESRGAHWRREHQSRKDEEWLKHTMLRWSSGGDELYYKPVVLEGAETTYEPVERSY